MNRAAQAKCNCSWENPWWLVVAAILFQSLYISNAFASSLPGVPAYTVCDHPDQKAVHNTTKCLQHCASAIDQRTHNFINDIHPGIYFDQKVKYFTSINFSSSLTERTDYIPARHRHIYLTTCRLRI